MNEARAIWFSEFQDDEGTRHHFTLRRVDEQSDLEFIGRVKNFCIDLRNEGFYPVYGTPPPAKADDGELESIEVDSITLASGGEHPRWVVRGGWATKHGITCWPEVLKDAGILEGLDPMQENKPKGKWIAWYSQKPKQSDPTKLTADKVVRLERV